MQDKFRTEHDSLGEVRVPANALWGAQTQRAIENFPVSGETMPPAFISALALIKRCAARVNQDLGLLDSPRADAIVAACEQIQAGEYANQFPVDVYQTGSGTSTNMNINEVIARLASDACGEEVHPNDHVNMGQSSNDTIPSTIHVSTVESVSLALLPALDNLISILEKRASEFSDTVKTGRTHLMDAMPITLGQELSTWKIQLQGSRQRLVQARNDLLPLPQGGTAVGTGINTHPDFAYAMANALTEQTGFAFQRMACPAAAQSGQDAPLALSGQLRNLAATIMKISNDLRWMNSGPIHGLSEITLPALQPGSSIMPGKINPVIPESAAMVAAQVMGLDAAVGIAAQSGSFQLNVMLPLIARNLLDMIHLMTGACTVLAEKAIQGLSVNRSRLTDALSRNPVLVTALNPVIGYGRAAEIAKKAFASGRPVIDVAEEMTDMSHDELKVILDPLKLTRGGLPEKAQGKVNGGNISGKKNKK